jgi:hypothetical protein
VAAKDWAISAELLFVNIDQRPTNLVQFFSTEYPQDLQRYRRCCVVKFCTGTEGLRRLLNMFNSQGVWGGCLRSIRIESYHGWFKNIAVWMEIYMEQRQNWSYEFVNLTSGLRTQTILLCLEPEIELSIRKAWVQTAYC